MDRYHGIQKRQSPLDGFFEHGSIKTSPFGENRSAQRVYERSEKLVAALYLLTNHLPPVDTLARAIRSNSIELLEATLALRDQMRSPESLQLTSVRSTIRLLISLVRMLSVSGSISPQNTSIVMDSLDELGAFLTSSQRSSFSESVALSREDLEVTGPLIGQAGVAGRPSALKDVKDTGIIKDKTDASVSAKGQEVSPRRRGIIEVLRASGELGIRDIASHIPQYSEKMIQRELAELVVAGVVKKTGLKRWSRYSLNSVISRPL